MGWSDLLEGLFDGLCLEGEGLSFNKEDEGLAESCNDSEMERELTEGEGDLELVKDKEMLFDPLFEDEGVPDKGKDSDRDSESDGEAVKGTG
jgi:hypothetical protein